MSHHPKPSRQTKSTLDAADQYAVDAYKARSVWGAWWKLGEMVRRTYFTAAQRGFIRRYGERLDALACQVDIPRNEDERHFVRVCNGELAPTNDNERLWLLVQVVSRYEEAAARAARVSLAEHRAEVLEAENRSMREMKREDDQYIMELINDLRMATGEHEPPARQPLPICNVEHSTLRFRRRNGGLPIMVPLVDVARRWAPLMLPVSKSAIAQ